MSNPYEFDQAQTLLPHLRSPGRFLFWSWKGYRLPACQANLDRRLDTAKVAAVGEMPFRADIADDEVLLPRTDDVPWKQNREHASGQPIQQAHPTERVLVREVDPDYPVREIEIPAPRDGSLWVQGNPWPASRMATESSYDLHARIVWPDGRCWDMIGAVPHYTAWGRLKDITCRHLARWDPAGNLDPRDRPVTRAHIDTTALLLGVDEPAHRCALSIRGSDAIRSHDQDIGIWVALDPGYVESVWADLTPSARRIAAMWRDRGCYTIDHAGQTNAPEVTDGRWSELNLGNWAPQLRHFRRVTEAA